MTGAPAVFLDRDGVINKVVWRDGKPASPRSVDEFTLEDDAAAVIRDLKRRGLAVFVVTNQPDVRRGLMTDGTLEAIHDRLRALAPVDAIAACRHDDRDACGCRKPKPGLLSDLARRFGIDLSRSWLIGDQDRDIACGRAAGCGTILLKRPYNSGTGADHVVASLTEAAAALPPFAAPMPGAVPQLSENRPCS